MNIKKSDVNQVVEQLNFFMNTINEDSKVKSRKSKFNPKTGIVLEDKELLETVFKPGTKMRYGIDIKNKILKIMPSENIGTKVAARDRNKDGNTTSLIHIRRKQILELFCDAEELEFEIFEDCIIIKRGDKDLKENLIDNNEYILSKDEVEELADKSVDENIRRAVAKHSKKHPILQKIYDVVKEPLKVLSLFSGIGTMDYAFHLEGFETSECIEMDDAAVKTLKNNLDVKIHHVDINDIDGDKLEEVPVVIGGPPCQDHSAMNSKKVWDSMKNKLIFKYVEIVKKVKAKVFLIENVPGLLSVKGAYYLNEVKKLLPEFHIEAKVLNSSDYGSAQSRNRAYILGSRIGKIDMPEPTTLTNKKTVREAFDGITDDMPNALDYSKANPKTIERMSYVRPGNNFEDIPLHLRTKGRFANNFRRLHEDKQSCTIVNVGRTIIMPPKENRVLSIREMTRLFGLPDWYTLCGTMFQKQQQIANTVVVEVIRAFAKNIKTKLDEYYNSILMKRFNLLAL